METMKSTQLQLEIRNPLVVNNVAYISVNDFRLAKYEMEKAFHELSETEDKKISCLKELKKKLEEDESANYCTDEEFLLCYLRFGKFNCDKVYKTIRSYYSLRKEYTDFFTIPPHLETKLNMGFLTYLPYVTEEGVILFWVDFRKWKLEEISSTQFLQTTQLILDIVTKNPKAQINGTAGIWDLRGFSLKHAAQLTYPTMLMFLAKFIQDCYPLRIKCVFLLHTSYLFRTTYSAVRHLLKKKLRNRIKLLGSDMTELHQYVNPAILPKDYGGSLDQSECLVTQDILQNLDYLKYQFSFK